MILEKIKEHGGKIMFFAMNILAIITGIFFIKNKDAEKASALVAQIDAENYKSAVDYAFEKQQRVQADQENKISSVVENTGTINKERVVQVTKTIPAVTKKVTVEKSSGSATTSKTSTSTAKTSTPVATTVPKATTKTS